MNRVSPSSYDIEHMQLAIRLAEKGCANVTPNPAVGCVIVDKNNQIIGRGFHQKAGEPHAEINAINDAKKSGHALSGARMYVTLEPCIHQGKTGPCTAAILSEDIELVVIASSDPNPLVAGKGANALIDGGVRVEGLLLEEQAAKLNAGFFKRMRSGLPYVTVKTAMSLDGKTALASGESKWITSEASRRDVHRMRSLSCAMVTGVNTVNTDDPSLTVRLEGLAEVRQPMRVVLDSQLRSDPDKKIFNDGGKTTVLHSASLDSSAFLSKLPASAHANVIAHGIEEDEAGRLNLRSVLAYCAEQNFNHVMVEAGAILAGEFINQRLCDSLVVYQAPVLLGDLARSAFGFDINQMGEAICLESGDRRQFGRDTRLTFKLAFAQQEPS